MNGFIGVAARISRGPSGRGSRSSRSIPAFAWGTAGPTRLIGSLAFILLLTGAAAAAAQQPPLSSTPVLTQALTDSVFTGLVVTSSVLELAPGAVLTNPHRHDAALFGYVLEGAILTSLEHGPIQRYEEGEMFHEPLRILHTHFENPDPDMPAQVLLVTIAKPPQP